MAENNDIYWQQWQKLLEAAANIQGLLPGSVMIGGSAAAIHLKHRYSFDADHVLSNLKENYEQVLDFLEGIQPPFDSWVNIQKICEEISVALGDTLAEFQKS